jgi:hypothetical protein
MAPPYATLQTCIAVKKQVRDFFARGYKSGNKEYDTSSPVSGEKFFKRQADADESRAHRIRGSKSDFELAELVRKMPVSERSGNCGEMAALSALYAWRFYNIKRDCLYIGTISDPGDHVFCLVAPISIPRPFLHFNSVTEFAAADAAALWAICDPWLNVACGASDYMTNGAQKLDKWQAEGKRVAWNDGTRWDWFPPGGDYKVKFGQAPVDLLQF